MADKHDRRSGELSERDQELFSNVLTSAPEPNKALTKAAKRYREEK